MHTNSYKLPALLLPLILFCLVIGCTGVEQPQDEWVVLFNGENLEGWDSYLGARYSNEMGNFDGDPIGINNDPTDVFTVVEMGGRNVIRISGEHFGGISTQEAYSNYHLQLQFRWGELKYAPRDTTIRDSGVLYHASEPHGASFGFWMASQEFQVQEGDCGDYWGLLSNVDAPVIMNEDGLFTYSPEGTVQAFGAESDNGLNIKKSGDAEYPNGQWNTLDLYTFGETSIHMINGEVMMVLSNSRQMRTGEMLPLTSGKIQIQSEGAEIYYRDIRIQPIEQLPELM